MCPIPSSRAEEQEAKIKQLQELLANTDGQKAASQLVQGGEFAQVSELTSEGYLRRWLRARRWDVAHAHKSILAHAQWRVEMIPQGMVLESEVANEMRCQKAYLQGLDNHGRPVLIIHARKHNGWTRRLEELEKFCCYLLDKLVSQCDLSTNPRGHISVLLDLTDMGAVSLDVQAMQALFKLLGEHYVERLGVMYMYNPPMLFWGAWNTLSPLLPPVTREKIHVIDPTKANILVEHIGAEVLPVEYGGKAKLASPAGL